MKRIAIQGLSGSFHHEAALHYFGERIVVVACETFREVATKVRNGQTEFALMAIENSLAGCIIPNYALLLEGGLSILGEIILRVKMNLMSWNGVEISDIREIQSHQMAIRQCSSFLDDYHHLRVVESFDTAGSAKLISEEKMSDTAAIASALAAKTYGLTILKEGIENKESFTRFLVLGRNSQSDGEANKASIYLQTKHEPGALASVLTVISDLEINLSKLQSHPVSGRDRTYGFFLDLEFQMNRQWEEAIAQLAPLTELFKVLGVYKKGEAYE